MDARTNSSPSQTRRLAGSAVALAVGVVLLLVLLTKLSWNDLAAALLRAHVGWLLACLAIGLLTTLMRAFRYTQFFPAPGRLPRMYGVFAVSRGINYLLPFRTGEFALLALLKKNGLSPTIAETAPIWLLLRVSDVCALGLLSVVAVGLAVEGGVVGSASVALVGLSLIGLMLLAAACVWANRGPLRRGSTWFAGRLDAFRQGLRHLNDKGKVIRTFAFALVIAAAMATLVTLVQIAFDSPLPVNRCFVVGITVLVVNSLPIHGPLGIGTDDACWTGLMVLAGLPLSEAVALALCARFVLNGVLVVDCFLGLSLLRRRFTPTAAPAN